MASIDAQMTAVYVFVDDYLHAASRLPLGLADKIFLSLAEPDAVPPESHLLGRFDSDRTGSWAPRLPRGAAGFLIHSTWVVSGDRDEEAAGIV